MNGDLPRRIILVPGFMSPNWMFYPLHRYLRKHHAKVELWDHPHVFSDPVDVARELRKRLSDDAVAGDETAIITHSFGDWVVRRAIESAKAEKNITKLVALCPVVCASPAARFASSIAHRWIPEIEIMADPIRARDHLDLPASIDRLVIWARWDPWVRRLNSAPRGHEREAVVAGTHNSVVFQPNVWEQITQFLNVPSR